MLHALATFLAMPSPTKIPSTRLEPMEWKNEARSILATTKRPMWGLALVRMDLPSTNPWEASTGSIRGPSVASILRWKESREADGADITRKLPSGFFSLIVR